MKTFFIRNKGSSNNLMNPLGLANASPRPIVMSLPDPGRPLDNHQIGRSNCRKIWDEFVEWLLDTLLKYARCCILLGLMLVVIQLEHFVSRTTGATTTFSLLNSFTLGWLVVEWIAAHIGISTKDLADMLIKRFTK